MGKAEIDAARRAAILAREKLVPKGCCHFCGYRLGARGELWCAQACADDYAEERTELLGPQSVEFGVVKGGLVVPVVARHTGGPDDGTALQLISAELLGYYQRLDQAARVLLTPSQLEQIRAVSAAQPGNVGAPVEA